MQPTASVMMPAYNADRYIQHAINSVLGQKEHNWELLIVNDGSEDRTAEALSQFKDSRIRVFYQDNRGESAARNIALTHAQGVYLAFLDADDCYLPNHLNTTISYLNKHPDCDAVYTDGYYIDENGLRLKPLSARRCGPFQGDIFEAMVHSSNVFGASICVVIRTDLVIRLQLNFDTDIVIGPDWDFLTRYAETGRFGYVAERTCLYRVHETNISMRTDRQQRALHLARCREKMIKLKRFGHCSPETRGFVFYDLLVRLLDGYPERQSAVVSSPEFTDLPRETQAKLLRLMATEALLKNEKEACIAEWLQAAMVLNPRDIKGRLLQGSYSVSPQLCRLLVTFRRLAQRRTVETFPFGGRA